MTENTQQKNLSYYCQLFSKIKVNKSKKRGEAPYKPILLLSVIDLISQNKIQNNEIYITDELIATFNRYWNILSPDSFNGGLALPFFHLKNDGFWKLQFSQEYDGGRPQTIPKLKEDVDYAILDQDLFGFLQDSNSREELITTIIAAWFLSSKKEIEDILKINQNLESENERELQKKKTYLRKSIVRDAFFRKAIVHLYDYKCSICHLKVVHSLTQSIVDGAHIKPLYKFYDNHVNNGICLCKNHHWAFDQGLWTINDDYRIIVSQNFYEESPYTKPLGEFHGQIILLPGERKNYPRLEAIQWHRQNIFRA